MNPQNELTIVTKAKELCSYIVTITQKSPKQFRFTFVSRLQNLSLDAIEKIYFANEVFISKTNDISAEKRLSLQHHALTLFKLIAYISELAMKEKCILLAIRADCQAHDGLPAADRCMDQQRQKTTIVLKRILRKGVIASRGP